MPCREGCGACCDPVFLSQEQAEKIFSSRVMGPLSERHAEDTLFIVNHWQPYAAWGSGVALICTEYDPASRSCKAYDHRPPVCRDYPLGYTSESFVDKLVCGYQAEEGRTVLPLVEIR